MPADPGWERSTTTRQPRMGEVLKDPCRSRVAASAFPGARAWAVHSGSCIALACCLAEPCCRASGDSGLPLVQPAWARGGAPVALLGGQQMCLSTG